MYNSVKMSRAASVFKAHQNKTRAYKSRWTFFSVRKGVVVVASAITTERHHQFSLMFPVIEDQTMQYFVQLLSAIEITRRSVPVLFLLKIQISKDIFHQKKIRTCLVEKKRLPLPSRSEISLLDFFQPTTRFLRRFSTN